MLSVYVADSISKGYQTTADRTVPLVALRSYGQHEKRMVFFVLCGIQETYYFSRLSHADINLFFFLLAPSGLSASETGL